MSEPRLWTLAEADAMLPTARRLLAEARRRLAAVRDAEAQLRDLRTVWGDQVLSATCPDHAEWLRHLAEFQAQRDAYAEAAAAFPREGMDLKDPDQGLVDFHGRLGTRTVLLCWRDGEDAITHYHDLDAGFVGRKRIPALQL